MPLTFYSYPQETPYCVVDGDRNGKDSDSIVLVVTTDSPVFKQLVDGQVFHSPRKRHCIQNWAKRQMNEHPNLETEFRFLIAWADGFRATWWNEDPSWFEDAQRALKSAGLIEREDEIARVDNGVSWNENRLSPKFVERKCSYCDETISAQMARDDLRHVRLKGGKEFWVHKACLQAVIARDPLAS